MGFFCTQLTAQSVVSIHHSPSVAYSCRVSVFTKAMSGSNRQLCNLLMRLAHASTLVPRPQAVVSNIKYVLIRNRIIGVG